MEKAFDMSDLVARLKANGLDLAEDAAIAAIHDVFAWTTESCKIKGGIFAVVPPVLELALPAVLAAADKIDGHEG